MPTTELHRLIRRQDIDGVARLLTARRVDVDAYDDAGSTALMIAAKHRTTDTQLLELLLRHGATLSLTSRGDYDSHRTAIAYAVAGGDPRKVEILVAAGADLHFRDGHDHDALLNAVHHRDIARDPHLLKLLRLLISHGVELNTVTRYNESGLRVLSRLGRFDAIQLLLEAGADSVQLQWTPLHRAVALGTLDHVRERLENGESSEERDWWHRTPWLLAILAGDTTKAPLLQDYGADTNARGRCGATPLSLAVLAHRPQMLQWLIESGQHVDQTDDFASTALFDATDHDDVECARILLDAGANLEHRDHVPQTALASAQSAAMVRLLLDAGADIRELSREGSRSLLGFAPDGDIGELDRVSPEEFARGRDPRFGTRNPELIDEPFWTAMIRAGVNGYLATRAFKGPSSHARGPVWCADRFGQSLTFLPDGRIVQIAGEHEDSYDPDFCIYNDVFVHEPDGRIAIFGYPQSDFPPTDFHTATLLGRHIYVIGSVGYAGSRQYGTTPVYRLDIDSFAIERIECAGSSPGWICRHAARALSATEIEISSGKILTHDGKEELYDDHERTFVLDVAKRRWRGA